MRARVLVVLLVLLLPLAVRANDAASSPTMRVLSLAPSITETLFALELGEHVVGVTDYCQFPPEARDKPRIGALMNPATERMIALRPTHVFHLPTRSGPEEKLAQSGAKLVAVRTETIADIRAAIDTIGTETGAALARARLLAVFDASLQAMQAREWPEPRPEVLVIIGRVPGQVSDLYAAGPGTFLDELVTLAGGKNNLADMAVPYPLISRERLLARPPDVIVDLAEGDSAPDAERDRRVEAQWRALLGTRGTNTRIVFVTGRRLVVPGPFVAESVGEMARAIHPGIER